MTLNTLHIFKHLRISTIFLKVLIVFLIAVVFHLHATYIFASGSQYPALRESIDPKLQAAFEKTLTEKFGREFWDLVKAKKVGIVLADITDPHKPRVAEVNGDVMLYAASLPKIAIVLGAFVQIERGEMVLDDSTRQSLNIMVRKSSNKAATEILHRVAN